MGTIREYVAEKHPIADLLKKHLGDSQQPLTIFEAGACEGEDTVRYLKMFPNCFIHAFEPIIKNFNLVVEHVKEFDVEDRLILLNCALGDKKGKAEFHVSSGTPTGVPAKKDWDYGNKSSSLLDINRQKILYPWLKFDMVVEVEVVTLDDIIEERGVERIDLLHLDVQGAEMIVFKGCQRNIEKIKSLWVEVSDHEIYEGQVLRSELEQFLTSVGFTLVYDRADGPLYHDQYWVRP